MRILLIEPNKPPLTIGGDDVYLFEPLALETVAAGVLPEHEVKILDLRLERDLNRVLFDFDPQVVGITAYTVHLSVAKALFRQIKAWKPGVLTVVGGHHATVSPEDFLSPDIDCVVVGEGVLPFREIVSRHERGESKEGIPGLCTVEVGKLSRPQATADVDLNTLPIPARSLTSSYRKHYYSEWMKPLASLRTSKGCPFRCRFCAQWKTAGGRYYKREPQKVVEELLTINEGYVFFADDESLIDADRMEILAQEIQKAGIHKKYFLYGRSDTIVKNPGLLKTWRDIGLERVFVGIEFFKDKDLAFIQKNATSKDNEGAIRILHDLGIEVYASFIVRPEFTKEDFRDLKGYCRKLKLKFASFAVLTPLPGTDLYEETKDRFITRNTDYFDFLHTILPTRLPLKEFYLECTHLYKHAIARNRQLSFLSKYKLSEIPGLLAKGNRLFKRLENAYKDYDIL